MVLDPKIKYIVFCKYYVVSAPVECKLVKLETSRTMIRWVFSAITITEIEKLPKPTTECSSVKIVFETVEIGFGVCVCVGMLLPIIFLPNFYVGRQHKKSSKWRITNSLIKALRCYVYYLQLNRWLSFEPIFMQIGCRVIAVGVVVVKRAQYSFKEALKWT